MFLFKVYEHSFFTDFTKHISILFIFLTFITLMQCVVHCKILVPLVDRNVCSLI